MEGKASCHSTPSTLPPALPSAACLRAPHSQCQHLPVLVLARSECARHVLRAHVGKRDEHLLSIIQSGPAAEKSPNQKSQRGPFSL